MDTTTRLQRLRDVMAFRRIVEPQCAALAADQATDADVERLAHILAEQEQAPDQPQLDLHFHLTLARATKNTVIRDVIALVQDILAESRAPSQPKAERLHLSLEGHRRILKAMRQRDPDACRQAMDDHLRQLEAYLLGPE